MPAQKDEIQAALAEGIKMEYLAAPIRFQGKNGHLTSVVCQRMTLGEFDAGGRKKPVPRIGDEFTLDVDQTRRLLAFCELPWHEDCLSFHKSERPIRTVSVEQAREPIYKSSIQGWKRYEKQLQPLLAALNRNN